MNMYRYAFSVLAIYLCLQFMLLGTACKHEPLLDDELVPVDTTPVDTTNVPVDTTGQSGTPCDPNIVYFNAEILPILNSNCAFSGCHDAASAQDGVVLTSYQTVMATADVRPFDLDGSDLYEVLVEDDLDKRMPKAPNPPLSQAQIQLIGKWISQGAKNLECDPDAGACNTDNVSYNQFIKPLLANFCVGCHSGSAPSGGVTLNTYQGVKTVALNGKLHGAVSWQPGSPQMPQGGNKLPDCTIDKIKSWIDAGAPEN